MSTMNTLKAFELTLRHPDGTVRLEARGDVPLADLIPDLLDVAEQPDAEDWVISHDGNGGWPYAHDKTLAELAAVDPSLLTAGATLELRRQPAITPRGDVEREDDREADAEPDAEEEDEEEPAALASPLPSGSPNADTQRSSDADERPGGEEIVLVSAAGERPLSERTAGALPDRLACGARLRLAVRALVPPRAQTAGGEQAAAFDPGRFARPARVSPLARARETWRAGDYQQQLDQLVQAPRLQRCVKIAVISLRGGVGKTTISALLGSLLAFLRRDRIVAVDADPDWGFLGRRLVPTHDVFIDDLLASFANGDLTPTQLDARLGRGPDGLMVAPAPTTDQERAQNLGKDAYGTLIGWLSELVGTLVLDCDKGLDSPPTRAALECADQVVLVCDDEPDTAGTIAEAAKEQRLQRINRPVMLVVNDMDRASRINVAALAHEMPFARGLAVIPRDERAAGGLHGSSFSWTRAPAGWQIPVRELAALLAAGWQELNIARASRC